MYNKFCISFGDTSPEFITELWQLKPLICVFMTLNLLFYFKSALKKDINGVDICVASLCADFYYY